MEALEEVVLVEVGSFRKGILKRDFFLQDIFVVLRELLGKVLIHQEGDIVTGGRIIEVEAYPGGEDKGSHTYLNKRTPRTEVQFGVGGHAYIYTVHTHHLLNIVVGEEGKPGAVLIRAIEPMYGIDNMKERRGMEDLKSLTNGPGKFTQAMNITKLLNGIDLCNNNSELFLIDDGFKVREKDIVKTKRVGIDYAEEFRDVPWRWYLKDNMFVSRV
ncbi:MAG: DNA-3-methyladenine glycosylase [Candidatus Dojkabacteria bacterium]|jgi:DNA-3-methyladenine glycosylase